MLDSPSGSSSFAGAALGSLWMKAAPWQNRYNSLEQQLSRTFIYIYSFLEHAWSRLKAPTCVRSRAGEHHQSPGPGRCSCSTAPTPAQNSSWRVGGRRREEESTGRDGTVQPGCLLQGSHCAPRVPLQGTSQQACRHLMRTTEFRSEVLLRGGITIKSSLFRGGYNRWTQISCPCFQSL